MDLSGIIFVVLALAWAVYLIPKALKHHDEMARTRSIDRFSTAMRVLARREPVRRRIGRRTAQARLVVTPPRTTDRILRPSPEQPAPPSEPEQARTSRPAAARRAAARVAARRRRRVLSVLLFADVAVVTAATLAALPWWSVTIPVALTATWLVLCRLSVRREQALTWSAGPREQRGREDTDIAPRRAIRVEAPYGTPQAPAAPEVCADEDTVALDVSALRGADGLPASTHQIHAPEIETVAVAVETTDGGSLWDPLPVTLPTYVGKARATARSVHTIDLGAPGAWTSGHDEADTALVEEAQVAAGSSDPVEEGTVGDARAVGS